MKKKSDSIYKKPADQKVARLAVMGFVLLIYAMIFVKIVFVK